MERLFGFWMIFWGMLLMFGFAMAFLTYKETTVFTYRCQDHQYEVLIEENDGTAAWYPIDGPECLEEE